MRHTWRRLGNVHVRGGKSGSDESDMSTGKRLV